MDERWRVLCAPKALILTRLTVLVGNGHTTTNGIPTSRVLVDAPSPSRLPGSASIQYQYESAGAEGDGTRHAIQGHRS